jgi:hypothetical protein
MIETMEKLKVLIDRASRAEEKCNRIGLPENYEIYHMRTMALHSFMAEEFDSIENAVSYAPDYESR